MAKRDQHRMDQIADTYAGITVSIPALDPKNLPATCDCVHKLLVGYLGVLYQAAYDRGHQVGTKEGMAEGFETANAWGIDAEGKRRELAQARQQGYDIGYHHAREGHAPQAQWDMDTWRGAA